MINSNIQPYQSAIPTINDTQDKTKLKEQTDAFEALIIKILLDTSMENDKNIFSDVNDPGEKIFKSMQREELANASAGSFGFSQLLFDFLSQKN